MKYIYDPKIMIRVLIVTSLIMFFSLFVPSNKLVAITMLIFLLNVLWVFHIIFGVSKSFVEGIVNNAQDKAHNAGANGQRFLQGTYSIAIPMCAVGLIIVFLMIVSKFFE